MLGRKKKQKWLIFIDTNILLDYYRIGGDLAEKQLDSLLRHKNSIITSEQIRMEFLKNRQKVIFETIKSFKKPESIALPTIIRDMKAASMLGKRLKASLENHKKNQIKNPTHT